MKTQAVSHLLNKNACNKTKLTSTHDFKRAACFPARSGGTGGKTQAPIYTWDGSAMFVAMCFPRSLKAQWLRRSDFQCHCADDGSVGDDGGTRVVLSGLRLAEELASSLSSPVLLQKNGRWYPLRSYFYPSAREAVSFDWTYNTTCSKFIDPEMGRDKDREAQSLFWSL